MHHGGRRHEAASLAGHLGLGKLICVYDDNRITIDGDTDAGVQRRHRRRGSAPTAGTSIDLGEIGRRPRRPRGASTRRRPSTDKPRLLVLRSHIGYPSPDHTDDHEAHGLAFDADDVTRTKAVMGIPDEPFWSPPELVAAYRNHAGTRGAAAHAAWSQRERRDDRLTPSGRRPGTPPACPAGPTTSRRSSSARRSPPARRSRRRSTPPSDPARARGRRRRPHRQHRHQARWAGRRSRPSDPGRAPDLLRRSRARHGLGDGRHGDARRDPPRRRHVLRVRRLHAPVAAAGRAVERQGLLRLHPRLGRRRRGRADPPAGRADRERSGRSPGCT